MAFNEGLPAQWGSSQEIPPADVVGQLGPLKRLVMLNGDAHKSEMATIALFATGLQVTEGTFRGLTFPGGPLVAVANFSAGGGGGQIEFDVPTNLGGRPSDHFSVIQGGGAMVSFPCADVDVQIRNDANYVPFPSFASSAAIGGATIVGINPRALALAGAGPKTGRLTRSVWMLNADPGVVPGDIPVGLLTPVPPYARTFRVFRVQTNPADTLTISPVGPGLSPLDSFTLAGNALSPDFVVGDAAAVLVTFAGAGTLKRLILVFTLQMGGE